MRLPIIISESGDIQMYHSLEYAQISIEPSEVSNDEYVVYDADGFLLKATVIDDPKYDIVRIHPTDENRKEELVDLLVDFFSEVGHQRDVLETMNLSQLIELGNAYFKPRVE